ncbi:MAG: sulfatase-like hydrolase/transferase [Verrucomicrobiota bacterium]
MKFPSLLIFIFGALAAEVSAAEKPNIILIMADDLGIEGLSCYGGESYETPHLDRMAAEGMQFTQAYSQPLCTPTRLQIMTGLYNQRNWLYFGILPKDQRTFGHLMQELGYTTGIFGKWQLTSYDPPDYPGSKKRRGTGMHPKNAGFDEYALFHAEETEDKGSRYADPTYLHDGTLVKEVKGKYGEDISVDLLLDFMQRKKDGDQPMFIYYPMALPHWPVNPTPDSSDWTDPARRLDEDEKYFPDMVAYMDKLVGRIIQEVDAMGLGENTLILFYSDNGTDRKVTSRIGGMDLQGGKNQVTQNGIRVPLVARWKGTIEPGRESSQLIDASDFLPTLAHLAGGDLTGNWQTDGLSFAPALLGREGRERDWCFFWYDPRPGWDKDQFTRHIFALDDTHKLYEDGTLVALSGPGKLVEDALTEPLSPADEIAKRKLEAVIEQMMQPPLSKAALTPADEFGHPE